MKKRTEILSIVISLTISFALGFLSIEFFGDYGWTVFVFIPFFLGFFPPFLTNLDKDLSRKATYNLSLWTLFLACLSLLIFAYEGMICILMAAPIIIPLNLLGGYTAYKINNKDVVNQKHITILLIVFAFGFMGFDRLNETPNLVPVKTSVIVDAPIEEVWDIVIAFDQIEAPTEWIFKTGISYPINATIEGKGVGAIRYCNFSTGSFVEPITKWEAPNLLQFDVKEQPIPMHEFNPFWEIHPPHLDGYFKSHKGQFKLVKRGSNQTELEGTTWYSVDIAPQIYWQVWSTFIIHQTHERVLNHIKKQSEK